MRHLVAVVVGTALLGSFSATAQPAGANATSRPAPEIGLPDGQGKTVRIAELKGSVVVVDFWASWCSPCRDELLFLDALYQEHKKQGLVVVGVGQDKQANVHARFAAAAGLSFLVVHDPQGAVAGRYASPKMPSTYLIDRRGRIRHAHSGWQSGDEAALRRELRALLAEK